MAKSRHYYIRRTHRYLGLILGIQFLIWTISGLYFSWANLDEVHGDPQHKKPSGLHMQAAMKSPVEACHGLQDIKSLQLVEILGKPYYSVSCSAGRILVDASTGASRAAVSREEAIAIARENFMGDSTVSSVEYLAATDGHHEYREHQLPAWGVRFADASATTVYIAAATGRVEAFRNGKWRIFDFLWMGHTMDYRGRDNINNWLLRIFSIFGLLTVVSGFVLYGVSSRFVRRRKVRSKSEL